MMRIGAWARRLAAFLGVGVAVAAHGGEVRIGATAGPYADQLRVGIKPLLEKRGYQVKIVEFNDYVQPNLALAQGSIHANVFQNPTYLKRFAEDHGLALTGVVEVPTAPIGLYSKRHPKGREPGAGARIAMPNDPTNQARSLAMLAQAGWIALRPGSDPLRVSERDIASNPRQLRIVPLEAAQTPRALDDVDYAFVNGNYALASGLKLGEAVILEKTPAHYMIVVTVPTSQAGSPFATDLVAAYRSPEFREVARQRWPEYVWPDYLKR